MELEMTTPMHSQDQQGLQPLTAVLVVPKSYDMLKRWKKSIKSLNKLQQS